MPKQGDKSPKSSLSEAGSRVSGVLKKIGAKFKGSKEKKGTPKKGTPTGKAKSRKKDDEKSRGSDTTEVDPAEDTSRASTDTKTDHSKRAVSHTSNSDDSERARRRRKRRRPTRDFENTDKSGVYHVIVRVIEGRDLPGVNLRMKALVDGRSESTRISSEKDPRWRQNLSFTLKRSVEKMSDTLFELKLYQENRLARDKLHGEWTCFLGTILHQPDRCFISKWVALRRPKRDELSNDSENVGFLRISMAIYGSNETPPPMPDDDSDEMFAGAQLLQFTLRLRLFNLHPLTEDMHNPFKNESKKPLYSVLVTLGETTAECDDHLVVYTANINRVLINQEITMPIMWPTVINSIHFALVLSRGKKARRIVARASILLSSIYVAGEDGFLPTFGPSFINFYGPQRILSSLKRRKLRHPLKDFDEHKFYCRMLLSIDCFDTPTTETTLSPVCTDAFKHSQKFDKYYKYALCASFFNCSNIDPEYANSSIFFVASIGNYGTGDSGDICERSSTMATTPYHDGARYFTLPWGNYKPMVHVECVFDISAFRIERINAIMKVVNLLDHFIDEARVNGDQSPEDVASITVDAVEHTCKMLESLLVHHKMGDLCTGLDFDQFRARNLMIGEMRRELVDLKYNGLALNETVSESMRLLCRVRDWVRRMAQDDSASLPDVFVKMFANDKMIGIARIPTTKIFFSKHDSLRGDLCGKLHAYPIHWLQMTSQRKQAESVAGVLHGRFWVGDSNKSKYWRRDIQPAEQKSYLEAFQYQKKTVMTDFKDDGIRTLTGAFEIAKHYREAPRGWKYKGRWFVMNTHSIWINEEAGMSRRSVIDKLFELEWKPAGEPNADFVFLRFTDYYGKKIPSSFLDQPPPEGWEIVGDKKWSIDLHSYGDKEGWCYSITDVFWGDAEMRDDQQSATHLYRRRCLQRMRRWKEYSEADDDLQEFVKGLRKEEMWEYSTREDGSFHTHPDKLDCVRRRRCLIEIVKKEEEMFQETMNIPRIYEVHTTISKWQMRAYVLWAKELLPSPHARVFVRVTFMHHCMETHIVTKTQHPIWNETMIFTNLLIPGAQNGLKESPPAVLVEVKGERLDDREVFLGRFYAKPVIIVNKADQRASLSWNTLHFRNQKTRGALLAGFELFLFPTSDVATSQAFLPPEPAKKTHLDVVDGRKRFEVPPDMRPTFEKYTVQALFWGVRNLAKYQMLSVRRPIVEIIVGDEDEQTGPLQDVTKNPNFDEPFITFDTVKLPSQLHLAPPLVLNLYDQRAFKRTPLVGTCAIPDFKRYTHVISKSEARAVHDYTAFEKFVDEQDDLQDVLDDAPSTRDLHEGDGDWSSSAESSDVRIDWWSKYYYSAGQLDKAPYFTGSGYDQLRVYESSLESLPDFKGFEDFLDTFKFVKSSKGHFDDAEEKEVTGELKGKLFITKHVNDKPCLIEHPPGVEFTGPVECVVRVYVIEAKELVTPRHTGICDPYIVARLGKQKIKLSKSYRADTTEPEFGEMIEFRARIPIEKDLTITLMDKRVLMIDEEIGSTRIDLENRLLSKYRGTVGISDEFVVRGDLGWRDQQTPLRILLRYCKKMMLPTPEVLYDGDKQPAGLKVLGLDFLAKEVAEPKRKDMCGSPIQRIALFILHKIGIVPEHVETRTLYSLTHGGNVPCGRLRCFVDVFPVPLGPIPPALDISLREPQPYQLRIALFHITNAILCKRSFGKPSGDLYLKVFVNGQRKPQKTDIHYRVTDGLASFNWRIIIDFDYNPWEKKVYMYEKKRMFKKAHRELVDPLVIIQLWDNNKFKKDGFIGEYTLNLFDIEYGKLSEGEQRKVRYAQEKKTCWCIIGCKFMCGACVKCCCTCLPCNREKAAPTQLPLPRAPRHSRPAARPVVVEEPAAAAGAAAGDAKKKKTKGSTTSSSSEAPVSLFDMYATQGVWPLLSRTLQKDQKMDAVSRKKKNDDAEEADYVMGCLEMELQLLTKGEAVAEPAGKKRNEPNHNPYLEKPERSNWDSFWLTSRVKPAVSFWWRKCGAKFIMVLLCVSLAALLFVVLIYKLSDLPFRIFGL